MRTIRSRRRAAAALLAGAIVMIGTVGCAAGDRDGVGSATGGKPAAPAGGPATGGQDADAQDGAGDTAKADALAGAGDEPGAKRETAAGDPAQGSGTEQGGATPTRVDQSERSIIYTGSITIRVDDVDAAAARAGAAAAGAGGFVGGDQRTIDARRSQATLTLRVPSERFSAFLTGLSDLGDELSRSIRTEDVTEQVADVTARIATARASVDRVRELLARAQSIGEIVSLESELSRREADLESLEGRLRKLSDLTALSTVTVVLLGPDAKLAEKREPETGFLAGFRSGWHAFISSLVVLLTVIGALLPWLVALAVPSLLVIWLARRASRRRPAGVPPPPAGAQRPVPRGGPVPGESLAPQAPPAP